MEITTLFGLPAHPLLVHMPVVIVPLAALMAVVMAFHPAWLDRFGWWLVAFAGAGFVGAILAASSGEQLQELPGIEQSAGLDRHAELGQTAEVVAGVFFFVTLIVVGARWWARHKAAGSGGIWEFIRSKAGAIVIAVVLVISAGAAMYTMVQVGHQGAKVTWNEKLGSG